MPKTYQLVQHHKDSDVVKMPVLTAEVISVGDILINTAGNAVVATGAGGGTIIGIAAEASANGETDPILVYYQGVFEFDLDAAEAVLIGDSLTAASVTTVEVGGLGEVVGRAKTFGPAATTVVQVHIESDLAT